MMTEFNLVNISYPTAHLSLTLKNIYKNNNNKKVLFQRMQSTMRLQT